jgi:hypothetical protein
MRCRQQRRSAACCSVDAVIGPDCEANCETSALFTAGRDLAQISYSCSSDLLANRETFPTVDPRPLGSCAEQPPPSSPPPHPPTAPTDSTPRAHTLTRTASSALPL